MPSHRMDQEWHVVSVKGQLESTQTLANRRNSNQDCIRIQLQEKSCEYLNGSSEGSSKLWIRKEAVDNGTDLDALGFKEIMSNRWGNREGRQRVVFHMKWP